MVLIKFHQRHISYIRCFSGDFTRNEELHIKRCIEAVTGIGQGAVVGATASVFKDVEPWTVVGGNPAKFIKKRVIKDE